MRNLILVLAFIATPAFASGYSAADAAYVTTSKDPNVLSYVVCLANAYHSTYQSMVNAFDVARVSCRGFAARIDKQTAVDIELGIRECGFKPDDASPDMGCE